MILDYQVMLRKPYEMYAAASWTTTAVVTTSIGLFSTIPSNAFISMAGVSMCMAMYRSWQTKTILDYKIGLSGKAFAFMDGREVVTYSKQNPDNLFLGFGFEWQPSHSQMAYDIIKEDLTEIYPPQLYLKLVGIKHDPRKLKGVAWLHGLCSKEQILTTTWENMEGHLQIFGTSGAGKTSLYELLILQMAAKGDAIFVFDPKGDKDLENICKSVMAFLGKPDRFIKFHPAFPKSSIRLDPMRNYNRGTETASRISSLTSSESGKDTFAAVTWDAINAIGSAERYLGFRPQLVTALKFLSSGVERLLSQVINKFLDAKTPGWQGELNEILRTVSNPKFKSKIDGATTELNAAVMYYKTEVLGVFKGLDADALDNLLRVAEYPRDWHSKMVANVIPLLTMLNSEELGKMLSPDYDDLEDERPIFDTQKIVDGKYLCYIGLDSLSDVEVGSAIASILLSDLASLAGATYNYTDKKDRTKVQVVLDEAAEIAKNAALIQMLNKSRGAGYSITLAAQNYADYVTSLGSESKARMLLGNCNNLITLRVVDGETQEYVISKIGETFIKQTSRSHGAGNRTEDHGLQFSGNITESISNTKVPVLPKDLLGKLQDLQYFSLLGGGKLHKGRFSKVSITQI